MKKTLLSPSVSPYVNKERRTGTPPPTSRMGLEVESMVETPDGNLPLMDAYSASSYTNRTTATGNTEISLSLQD